MIHAQKGGLCRSIWAPAVLLVKWVRIHDRIGSGETPPVGSKVRLTGEALTGVARVAGELARRFRVLGEQARPLHE